VCGGKITSIDSYLRKNKSGISKIVILVDENTGRLCLPVLKENITSIDTAFVMEIPAGETSKSVHAAINIWKEMLGAKTDRKTLLINLGGGMVSDLGGFVAAGFKRGIPYINIPTTLIGQVDASIGGKTSVNFDGLKNQIGFFHSPVAVFIFPEFLKTLPEEQIRSGMAEIIKCALISDTVLWDKIRKISANDFFVVVHNRLPELISKTVTYKNSVVRRDFREKGVRKILNFGHTVGHAFETFSRSRNREPILHGEAIAIGMVCESYLSYLRTGFGLDQAEAVKSFIKSVYPSYGFTGEDFPELIRSMEHDKKNIDDRINFTLLKSPGMPRINVLCDKAEIIKSLEYYLK